MEKSAVYLGGYGRVGEILHGRIGVYSVEKLVF